MAMGKRKTEAQPPLFIVTEDLPQSAGHPYYEAVNRLLAAHGFDPWVEEVCQSFYAPTMGRPSLAPGIYFRCLMVGYLEGIGSERGIAWRVADSLSLRRFLGVPLGEQTPDHSTISRTRRLVDLETHERVFVWVLKVLALQGLISGKTVGIDATTLEANAAMRSIVRNDTGQSYQDFLKELAKASGIETPTREDLARIDRDRPHKGSNDDWHNPYEPDARIAKMKDGSTRMAHKSEHAVDLTDGREGAVLAVTVQGADEGDTTTWRPTVEQACTNLHAVIADPLTAATVHEKPVAELVEDKGYHSNQTMTDYREIGIRSYVSEPDRPRPRPRKSRPGKSSLRKGNHQRVRRRWVGKESHRQAVYANRRRIRGTRGKRLMRKRGQFLERTFAHCYETGAMRRTHLRGHNNILKRLLVHVAGFNLSLVMRRIFPRGTPRGLQGLRAAIAASFSAVWALLGGLETGQNSWRRPPGPEDQFSPFSSALAYAA